MIILRMQEAVDKRNKSQYSFEKEDYYFFHNLHIY